MLIFADTANLDAIKELNDYGILDGVTTNPSLMAREGIQGRDAVLTHYRAICEEVNGPVSAEVIATDYEGMLAEGRMLHAIAENIVVKVPMTPAGIKAIATLAQEDIPTNCTLVFSPGQAILAAKAGASFVSVFMGRLDDVGHPAIETVQSIIDIYEAQGAEAMVLAASIRHPQHIIQCAEVGVDAVTAPPASIKQLFHHPLTDIGLEKFLADYRKVQQQA